VIEQKINETFGDKDPTGFGTGWWSGILSTFFGLLSLGAVVCLHFPQLLTSPELRPFYPAMWVMRLLIQSLIVAAILFGVASAILRKKKILGLTGMLLALVATLLGGASVEINEPLRNAPAIGLDWFLLDMLLMTLIFSPFEVLWPAYPKQGVFREQWLLDVVYFLSTHLPIMLTTFLILLPATQLSAVLGIQSVVETMGRLPWLVQFFLAVLVADLAEYAIHRAFHSVPWLWRFHAIHHSSKGLDWIAGSRSHLVDDVAVRGFILIPMMLVFPQDINVAYLFFVTLHATWTHSNFGPTIKWLEPFLIFPRFHHWHHTSQKEAIDRNFAIHFPWIDKIFGTYYFPEGKWPDTYGLHKEKIPDTFWGQFFYPFRRKKAAYRRLVILRCQRNVLGQFRARVRRPHQAQGLHDPDGHESKVVLRFLVAQAQKARGMVVVVLQAGAEGRCDRQPLADVHRVVAFVVVAPVAESPIVGPVVLHHVDP
jgi:lathosterol oxidase